MKKYHVYKIVDENDTILYIGETTDIENRFHVHTNIQGKFYKRKDIKLVIIDSFSKKQKAFNLQLKLQKENGFETDLEKLIKNASKGGIIRMHRYNKTGVWKKAIRCIDYKTKEFVAEFESIRKAGKVLNIKNIDKVLNGTYKHAGGYFFEYV